MNKVDHIKETEKHNAAKDLNGWALAGRRQAASHPLLGNKSNFYQAILKDNLIIPLQRKPTATIKSNSGKLDIKFYQH